MKNPNFLVFVVDAMRASWMGCAGHPLVKTPNLDALASRGTFFSRAYCAHPVCAPARASLLTGLMPRDHGVWSNGMEMHPRTRVLPQMLVEASYRTGTAGRLHYSPWLPGPDSESASSESLHGWNGGLVTEVPIPYYGFQHVDMLGGQGDYTFGPYLHWLDEQDPCAPHLLTRAGALEPPTKTPSCWKMGLPEELHYNRWIAERARRFIHTGRDEKAPWFLWCSFPDPHPPFAPPAPYCHWYDPRDMPEPVRNATELDRLPPYYRAIREGRMDSFGITGIDLPIPAWQEMTALSLGMVSHVDAEIGRVLNELDASGQREDTIILFLGDHGGDLLGDHWMRSFGSFPFETCVRIPFIMAVPGAGGGFTSDTLVSQIDIVPTILDLAGVAQPQQETLRNPPRGLRYGQCAKVKTLPGRSLAAELSGEDTTFNSSSVLIENEEPYLGLNSRILVTPRYKMTLYGGQSFGQLFDLERDPHELHNRWDDPLMRGVKSDMMHQLIHKELALFAWQPLPIATA